MGFRRDAAKEFVKGTVEALNLYLGIGHIRAVTTGYENYHRSHKWHFKRARKGPASGVQQIRAPIAFYSRDILTCGCSNSGNLLVMGSAPNGCPIRGFPRATAASTSTT